MEWLPWGTASTDVGFEPVGKGVACVGEREPESVFKRKPETELPR